MANRPGGKRDYPCRGKQPYEVVRPCESRHWESFRYICDTEDLPIHIRRTCIDEHGREVALLAAQEIHAASNTTIILSRMLQKGKIAWLKRTMR